MLILPKRKSTFNFYESFSDLVFCALVMFLVLVLFLAMNVNQKQEQVEVGLAEVNQTRQAVEQEAAQARQEAERLRQRAEQEAEQARQALRENQQLRAQALALRDGELAAIEKERQRIIADAQRLMALEREAIAEERKKIQAQREKAEAEYARLAATLDARRSKLTEMERDLDRQRRLYEQALGTNRYTGLPGAPRLVVAYDWQPNRLRIHPVPAWLVDQLNATPPGLAGQALADYYARQRGVFLDLARAVEPLDIRQYRALIRAVSVGLEPMPTVGRGAQLSLDLRFATDPQGRPTNDVAVVIPGGHAKRAGVQVGDTLIALGDQPITPDNLPGLLAGYEPGDQARLLVQRDGKSVVIQVPFDDTRVVGLIEAYRTDLSMVVSGALDTDYTYLWAPAQADALRDQLQAGEANDVIWRGASRWQGKASTIGRPVLGFDATEDGQAVLIGDERFTPMQFRRVLEAIAGGGIVVEYQPEQGPKELPAELYDTALRPTGFVVRAPQLDKLMREAE